MTLYQISANHGRRRPGWALLVACGVLAGAPDLLAGTATLTIGPTPEQTFKGFGFSITADKNPWVKGTLNTGNREQFDEEAFNDLNVQFVRWWFTPGGPEKLDIFKAGYLAPGVIGDARAHGVQRFLLGPDRFSPGSADGETLTNATLHARILAENIKHMADHFGVTFDATGIINEPGAAGHKVVPRELRASLVKAMRSELDNHGLRKVKVVAPETASCDKDALEWAKAIDADPAAAKALDGFATHSYNMAATPEVAAYVRKNNWEYWQTEAGGDWEGNSATARFLNDLNQRVTHWTFFIGPHVGQGTHALLSPRGRTFTYYYMRQLMNRFLPGTVMRHTTSSIDGGEMVYTYGRKPHLNVAAGVRPDGKWIIGVVNDASGGGGGPGRSYYPAEDFDVMIRLPELANKDGMPFDVCRTRFNVNEGKCGETALMQNGALNVHLAPRELAILIAQTTSTR